MSETEPCYTVLDTMLSNEERREWHRQLMSVQTWREVRDAAQQQLDKLEATGADPPAKRTAMSESIGRERLTVERVCAEEIRKGQQVLIDSAIKYVQSAVQQVVMGEMRVRLNGAPITHRLDAPMWRVVQLPEAASREAQIDTIAPIIESMESRYPERVIAGAVLDALAMRIEHREVHRALFDYECACGGRWTSEDDLGLHLRGEKKRMRELLKPVGNEIIETDEDDGTAARTFAAQADKRSKPIGKPLPVEPVSELADARWGLLRIEPPCDHCGSMIQVTGPVPEHPLYVVAEPVGDVENLLGALRAIRGPEDRGYWIEEVYRPAGGGYAGLQAIARAALDGSEAVPQFISRKQSE